MTCANRAPPLLLPWEDVKVFSDSRVVQRGIRLGFGTPEQYICLRPYIGWSDVWLFNTTYCDDDPACIVSTGGVYDINKSSTGTTMSKQTWHGGYQPLAQDSDDNFEYFNDVLHFNDNVYASYFPFYMNPDMSGMQSGLGIGRNSTFLTAAVKSKIAPTRNWGLWAGSRSVIEPVDGSLIVGGYDSNRVSGEFTTFMSTRKCYSCIKVANLTYITPSNSTPLLTDPDGGFWAEISPWHNSMALPAETFQNFQLAISGTFATDPGITTYLTVPTDAELGNITITLQGGYTTVIPAREIFRPPHVLNKDGVFEISNDTYLVSLVMNVTDTTSSPAFGIPFLTMNYMTMEFDWDTFSLAPARQGPYADTDGPSIRPLCEGLTPGPSESAGAVPTNLSISDDPKGSDTTTTIIAGSVVGGVIGLAVIGFLIWFIVRRRTKKKNLQKSYTAVTNQSENTPKQDHLLQTREHEQEPWHIQMPVAASLDRTAMQDPVHDYQNYEQFYQEYSTATHRDSPVLLRIHDTNKRYQ